MHTAKSLQELIVLKLEEEARVIGSTVPVNLYGPIEYTLNMGGKRLRPVMLLMACELFGGQPDDAMNAALAVEIFHNFTLLHDDMMDQAELRRNQPAVHKKFNENIAILSGDAMSILAYHYLLKTETPAYKELIQLFSKTAIEVCEGQQYDMDFEERPDVSIDDYLKMIRLKTAVLIGCSFKMGALIGQAGPEDADRLYAFGINLGLAFQLQDDLLDVYADQEKFGKKIGGDIVANKKTFLLLKTLELATGSQRTELLFRIGQTGFDPTEKIEAVRKIYTESGVRQISESVMDDFYQKALTELKAVQVEESRKEALLLLAKTIMKREH